jgi:C-terminal processing protease CtpA/Prc
MAGKKNADAYKGKVIILVNEETISRAEFTAMALKAVPSAVVIGSTTLAADGDVSFISLPGGITTLMTGIGVYYPDRGETQRIGILPDILSRPGIRELQEGRDIVLEKAIQVIREK